MCLYWLHELGVGRKRGHSARLTYSAGQSEIKESHKTVKQIYDIVHLLVTSAKKVSTVHQTGGIQAWEIAGNPYLIKSVCGLCNKSYVPPLVKL